MCEYASTREQRQTIIRAIIPIAHHLDNKQCQHAFYQIQDTQCGHTKGTCHVDKDQFVKDILRAIQNRQWNIVSALFSIWDEMLSEDLLKKS